MNAHDLKSTIRKHFTESTSGLFVQGGYFTPKSTDSLEYLINDLEIAFGDEAAKLRGVVLEKTNQLRSLGEELDEVNKQAADLQARVAQLKEKAKTEEKE